MRPFPTKLGHTHTHTQTHFGAIGSQLNWPSFHPFFLSFQAFLQKKERRKGWIRKANRNKISLYLNQIKIFSKPRKSHIYSVGLLYSYGKELCISFSGLIAVAIIITHLMSVAHNNFLIIILLPTHICPRKRMCWSANMRILSFW